MSEIAELFDVFFNGRPAKPAKPGKVTIEELVRRKESTILHKGKLYRITVTPAKVEQSK